MLRIAIISPDTELIEGLRSLMEGVSVMTLVRTVDHYPTLPALNRLIRSAAPHVLFVSTESSTKLIELVKNVEQTSPGVQIVAVGRTSEPQVLLEVMRAGLREFLSLPFHRQTLYDCLSRVREQAEKRPPATQASDRLFCFLPAKPGVGATTIAVNTALAMARLAESETLLMDLDLNCGLVRFLLQLDNPFSVRDAAERAGKLDESLWPQLVAKAGALDVLHAGLMRPESPLDLEQLQELVEFARRNYQVILVDLSGNLERHSLELMAEARGIFLVTTPEVPALHLAREKLNFFRHISLSEKVSVLLNRCQKRSLVTPAHVEELLGMPPLMSFANDYQGIHKALTAGKEIDGKSELGKQLAKLAEHIHEKPGAQAQEATKRKFVEYFSVIPTKISVFGEKKIV